MIINDIYIDMYSYGYEKELNFILFRLNINFKYSTI